MFSMPFTGPKLSSAKDKKAHKRVTYRAVAMKYDRNEIIKQPTTTNQRYERVSSVTVDAMVENMRGRVSKL